MSKFSTIIILISILLFVSCSDKSPNDCEFIGKCCSTSIFSTGCDGTFELEFFPSGEFVISTIGATPGVATQWSSEDCQIVSITGDDGQGGNPQVFRFEILSVDSERMSMSGLGNSEFIKI